MSIEYKGYYVPEDSVPEDIINEWEATLKGERARILSALTTKISNATEFQNKLATPAADQWSNFINPDWADSDFIKLKHRVKLKSAYPSWNSGIQGAFAEGGTFETNVSLKKDKLQKARYTLGATGLKYLLGWGVAYKAIGFVTGDARVMLYMGANDTVTGSPTNIFPTTVVRFVRPLGLAIFTQGLVIAHYAHENGLTSERDAVITAVNQKLADSILKLYDSAAWTSVVAEIGYDAVADKIYARVAASPVS